MKREIKTFEVECDHCHATAIVNVTPRSSSDLPDKWGYYTSHGWGMTDYSRSEELCPKCLEQVKNK